MKLLLHICCAPCSVMCIDSLRGEGIEPTGFWFNPNIHPYTEYRSRKTTLEDYAGKIGLKLIIGGKYGLRPFLTEVGHCYDERCAVCYRMRLFETARYAAENGFTHFTSTLFISPYQQHELMIKVANEAAAQYGVAFLYRDFRPYFKEGQQRAREMEMYMQKYCGCIFSEEDRYQKRKKTKPDMDASLLAEYWQPLLKTKTLGRGRLLIEPSMDSTNSVLKQAALDGAAGGSVALCHTQTAGRGRMERKWVTPPGEALTLSVLVDSVTDENRLPMLTLCVSLAVVRALKTLCPALPVWIKWPNDVVIGGKKLCGILCELVFCEGRACAVCGIGINVAQTAFPEELQQRATSLKMSLEGQAVPNRGQLTAAVLNELEAAVQTLTEQGEAEVLRQYEPHCLTVGREVRVLSPLGEWQGKAVGVAADGTLRVERENGETEWVSCGDVSIRGLADYTG